MESPNSRAIFLDRDGVLIRTFVSDGVPHPPQSLDELEILRHVPEAINLFQQLGFKLFIVTNQPDVARGTQSQKTVEQMNEHLAGQLKIDGIYVCYHDNADRCTCRKPLPGMLLRAATDHGIDLPASYMVGDRASDIAAGNAAGCRTFLIDRPYSRCDQVKPTAKAADLLEVARCVAKAGVRRENADAETRSHGDTGRN